MKKKTTEQFVKESQAVHGDRYDYSLSEYIGCKTKVLVICGVHKPFLISPDNHIRGKGCPECGKQKIAFARTSTSAIFVEKSQRIHNGKYNYSKIVYKSSKSKVIITCRIHGDFSQTPSDHLSGCGCPSCANDNLSKKFSHSTAKFIENAYLKHERKYDYRAVEYVNSHTPVVIICRKHGLFEQIPYNHLMGKGCIYCSGKSDRNEKYVKSELKHRNIDIVNYSAGVNSINTFMCDAGHLWSTSLNSILNTGTGCPSCAFHGFNPSLVGYLYFLLSSCTTYIKIGITNNLEQRLNQLKKHTPFSFTLLNVRIGEGFLIRQQEKNFHKSYSSANLTGFDGATEWMIMTVHLLQEVLVDHLL